MIIIHLNTTETGSPSLSPQTMVMDLNSSLPIFLALHEPSPGMSVEQFHHGTKAHQPNAVRTFLTCG